jgi:hypothetical protein
MVAAPGGEPSETGPWYFPRHQEGLVKLRKTALGALSVAALVGSSLAIGATAASGDPSANVTICHRTNSNTNPYVQITVDESAVDGLGGGSDHLGAHTGPVWDPTLKEQHIKWGDIIPPFDANGDPRPNPSLIANWPAGQEIFENGCNPVEPPEPELVDLSVAKSVVGTAPEGATFTAQVTCDDGTSVEVTLPVAGGVGTPSPIEVELGSQCTVVETATGGADTVGYSIVGVEVDPGVFIDTDTTVTITNTFDEPEVSPEVVVEPPVVAPAAVTATPRTTG